MLAFEVARTFTLQQLGHVGGEDGSQEVGESSLPVRLQGLQEIADGQREHDPVHTMRHTLGNGNVLLLVHNGRSVDCSDLWWERK